MQILRSPSRNPLCNNKDMIPHQLLICEQAPDLNPGFCIGGQVLKCFSNRTVSNLPVNHSSCLWPWLGLSSCIIFYLHVCAELNYDSAPKLEALSILPFVRLACPPSTKKTFYCHVITSINETLPVTVSTIPHPLSPGLTPFALQIKERVYEPALAWHCWWGVITVERLSCSLHTLPLSSLGQKKKWKHREGVKQQLWNIAVTELPPLQHYGVSNVCEEDFLDGCSQCQFLGCEAVKNSFSARTTVFLQPHLFCNYSHYIMTEPIPL